MDGQRDLDGEQYLYLTTRGRKSGRSREIEIWFTHRDGRFYVIAVTDDGPGIARENQSRIFKLFQTLAPVQGDHMGGIGLAVVKKWVEGSGGSVDVVSPVDAGRGSTFRVKWPVDGEQVGKGGEQA